jgi:hypothetical protein
MPRVGANIFKRWVERMRVVVVSRHEGGLDACLARTCEQGSDQRSPDAAALVRYRDREIVDEQLGRLTACHRQPVCGDASQHHTAVDRSEDPEVAAREQALNVVNRQLPTALIEHRGHGPEQLQCARIISRTEPDSLHASADLFPSHTGSPLMQWLAHAQSAYFFCKKLVRTATMV